MKKILSILLTVAFVLSLCTMTAFADDKSADLDGHTYKAYQIFKGTQTADPDDATLGSIQWGDGINAEDFLEALQDSSDFGTSNPFAGLTTAAQVADAMKEWTDSSANAKAFAAIAKKYVIAAKGETVVDGTTELDAGYYLVVDTTTPAQGQTIEAYNLALLQLTKKGTFKIENKVTVPEVKKEIKTALTCTDTSDTHTHTTECYNWAPSNKKPIGGVEEYMVTGTIPASVTDYTYYYYYIVKDTLSKGLTLNTDSFAVKFVNGDTTTNATTADYTLKTGTAAAPYTFELALKDAKFHAGQTVIVTYSATVNNEAIIGIEGNTNEVTVDYSNKPDYDYDGGTTPSGFPSESSTEPLGETPKSTTLTYVTELSVIKVDENTHPLQDAQFTLTGDTLKTVLIYKDYFELFIGADGQTESEYTYWKLAAPSANGDDQYTTTPPVESDYMNPITGATEGWVEAEEGYTGEDKMIIGDVAYRYYVAASDSGKTVYDWVKANTDKYDSTTDKYKKVNKFVEKTVTGTAGVSAFVDESGNVKFTGLDAGTYTLSETKVPAGYNPLPDITFTIKWTAPTATPITADSECTWSVTNIKVGTEDSTTAVTYDATTGTFSATVVNQKGSTLPETGGIGTRIFYIGGSVLVLAAAILLITKKRMRTED